MTPTRILLVAAVTIVGFLLELHAIHDYVIGVTRILLDFGKHSATVAHSIPAGGAGG